MNDSTQEKSIFDVLKLHAAQVSTVVKQSDLCESKVYPDQVQFTLTLELIQNLIKAVETKCTERFVLLVGDFVACHFLSSNLSPFVDRRNANAYYQGKLFGNEIWTDHSLNIIQKDILIVASITSDNNGEIVNNRTLVKIDCGTRGSDNVQI